jgi:hypothetical protein
VPTPPGFASASVQIVHSGLSRPSYITFGVNPTATDPQTVASAVATTFTDAAGFKSRLDNETVITQVLVSLGTDGGEDLVGAVAANVAGANTQATLPPNCAVLVHKRTARGGRRGRGRLFIPWYVGEASVDEAGVLLTGELNLAQAALNVWLASLATQNVPMVLLHDVSAPGTVHPTTPGPPDVVTSLTVDKLISTQRRRLGRR